MTPEESETFWNCVEDTVEKVNKWPQWLKDAYGLQRILPGIPARRAGDNIVSSTPLPDAPRKDKAMTQSRLSAIRKRVSEATPGPWRWLNPNVLLADHGHRDVILVGDSVSERQPDGSLDLLKPKGPNAALIAHAPSDLTYLLDRVERLEGALEIFDNRRKLAHSLRAESPHVAAFVEAIGVEMDKAALVEDGGSNGNL